MWLVLAAIAVAGFAAFDTDEVPPSSTTPPVVADRSSIVGLADSAIYEFEPQAPTWADPTPPETSTTTTPPPTTTTTSPPATTTTTTTAPTTTTSTSPPATTTTTTTTTPPPTTTTVPPTPTTTAPADATGAAVAHPPAVEAWRDLVTAWFPAAEVDRALEVMWCESRGVPSATNPTSGAAGLFQHIPRFWAERSVAAGFAGADIYDPEANVGVAAWLVRVDGWKHWYPSLHCWG